MSHASALTDTELEKIIDEATIYLCACPAQVAEQILHLRQLVKYQENCLRQKDTNVEVHETIGAATREAIKIMEACIDKVLELEQWDRTTLKMPAGLRALRDQNLP